MTHFRPWFLVVLAAALVAAAICGPRTAADDARPPGADGRDASER